jgi:hypothetical protein
MIHRLTNDLKIYGKIHQRMHWKAKISILKSMKILNLEMKLFLGRVWY